MYVRLLSLLNQYATNLKSANIKLNSIASNYVSSVNDESSYQQTQPLSDNCIRTVPYESQRSKKDKTENYNAIRLKTIINPVILSEIDEISEDSTNKIEDNPVNKKNEIVKTVSNSTALNKTDHVKSTTTIPVQNGKCKLKRKFSKTNFNDNQSKQLPFKKLKIKTSLKLNTSANKVLPINEITKGRSISSPFSISSTLHSKKPILAIPTTNQRFSIPEPLLSDALIGDSEISKTKVATESELKDNIELIKLKTAPNNNFNDCSTNEIELVDDECIESLINSCTPINNHGVSEKHIQTYCISDAKSQMGSESTLYREQMDIEELENILSIIDTTVTKEYTTCAESEKSSQEQYISCTESEKSSQEQYITCTESEKSSQEQYITCTESEKSSQEQYITCTESEKSSQEQYITCAESEKSSQEQYITCVESEKSSQEQFESKLQNHDADCSQNVSRHEFSKEISSTSVENIEEIPTAKPQTIRVNGTTMLVCSICNRMFISQHLLDRHLKVNHIIDVKESTEVVASSSSAMFSAIVKSNEKQDIDDIAIITPGNKPQSKSKKYTTCSNSFQCTICWVPFITKKLLFKHIKTHSKRKMQKALYKHAVAKTNSLSEKKMSSNVASADSFSLEPHKMNLINKNLTVKTTNPRTNKLSNQKQTQPEQKTDSGNNSSTKSSLHVHPSVELEPKKIHLCFVCGMSFGSLPDFEQHTLRYSHADQRASALAHQNDLSGNINFASTDSMDKTSTPRIIESSSNRKRTQPEQETKSFFREYSTVEFVCIEIHLCFVCSTSFNSLPDFEHHTLLHSHAEAIVQQNGLSEKLNGVSPASADKIVDPRSIEETSSQEQNHSEQETNSAGNSPAKSSLRVHPSLELECTIMHLCLACGRSFDSLLAFEQHTLQHSHADALAHQKYLNEELNGASAVSRDKTATCRIKEPSSNKEHSQLEPKIDSSDDTSIEQFLDVGSIVELQCTEIHLCSVCGVSFNSLSDFEHHTLKYSHADERASALAYQQHLGENLNGASAVSVDKTATSSVKQSSSNQQQSQLEEKKDPDNDSLTKPPIRVRPTAELQCSKIHLSSVSGVSFNSFIDFEKHMLQYSHTEAITQEKEVRQTAAVQMILPTVSETNKTSMNQTQNTSISQVIQKRPVLSTQLTEINEDNPPVQLNEPPIQQSQNQRNKNHWFVSCNSVNNVDLWNINNIPTVCPIEIFEQQQDIHVQNSSNPTDDGIYNHCPVTRQKCS